MLEIGMARAVNTAYVKFKNGKLHAFFAAKLQLLGALDVIGPASASTCIDRR